MIRVLVALFHHGRHHGHGFVRDVALAVGHHTQRPRHRWI
jgi:hypothetical protein